MIRRILLAVIASLALAGSAAAQVPGFPPSGTLQIGQGGSAPPAWNPINGDCTSNNLGAIVCTKTNGVTFYTGLPAPANPNDAATKAYVDASSAGLSMHQSVVLATTTALPANTYNNGTAGVGAALTSTCVSSCPAPTIDGSAVTLGQRIVVKNEAAPANNGIYVVSTVGTGTTPYVLTRATDANTAGTNNPNEIGTGTFVLVTSGTANTNTGWSVNSTVTTIGTSAINWAQFSASGGGVVSLGGMLGVITCGAGLICNSQTASIAIPFNYIGGLTLSNDSTTPNSILDIAAGQASDSTNATIINIGAFTKSTAGAWASGSAANGMGNGLTVAINTWYHVCLANNGGTPDVWFDTSATCANRPSGITDTKYRRIGSFKTGSPANIRKFLQVRNNFSFSQTTSANFGFASASGLLALDVPTGIVVQPIVGALLQCSAATNNSCSANIVLSNAAQTIQWAYYGPIATSIGGIQQGGVSGALTPPTNTSGQIFYTLVVAGAPQAGGFLAQLYTQGYEDTRGQ